MFLGCALLFLVLCVLILLLLLVVLWGESVFCYCIVRCATASRSAWLCSVQLVNLLSFPMIELVVLVVLLGLLWKCAAFLLLLPFVLVFSVVVACMCTSLTVRSLFWGWLVVFLMGLCF